MSATAWLDFGFRERVLRQRLTVYSHAVAPVQWVPDHGPVANRYDGLWEVLGREGAERGPRPAENEGLEAW
jgi:hypothetical protein